MPHQSGSRSSSGEFQNITEPIHEIPVKFQRQSFKTTEAEALQRHNLITASLKETTPSKQQQTQNPQARMCSNPITQRQNHSRILIGPFTGPFSPFQPWFQARGLSRASPKSCSSDLCTAVLRLLGLLQHDEQVIINYSMLCSIG